MLLFIPGIASNSYHLNWTNPMGSLVHDMWLPLILMVVPVMPNTPTPPFIFPEHSVFVYRRLPLLLNTATYLVNHWCIVR